MTCEAIRSRLERSPFLPLSVTTSAGSVYRVILPGQLALFGPDARKSVVLNGSGRQIPVESIISIDPEPVPPDYVAADDRTNGAQMTIEKFDEFLKRQPFVPFTVHVADGHNFEVRGPEFASRTENGRTIFVATGGDKTEWIDLLLITRISSGVNNPAVSSR